MVGQLRNARLVRTIRRRARATSRRATGAPTSSCAAPHRGRRRAPARSIPSRMGASSAASITLAASLPAAENIGRNTLETLRPHCKARCDPSRRHETQSHRFEKKTNKCPLSGSCRSMPRTNAIRLSAPLRPSTGCVATKSRTLGGKLNKPDPSRVRRPGCAERWCRSCRRPDVMSPRQAAELSVGQGAPQRRASYSAFRRRSR
jgi:hypothetical protein